jgi:CheY-like chemotaxis protein
MKILIIDDEENIRELIKLGIEIEITADFIEAKDGKEALEMIRAQPDIDLIICDYNMPRLNGGAVYQAMIKENINIPYVLCSSDGPNDFPDFLDRKIFIYHIEKPNVIESIPAVVEKYRDFSKEKTLSPSTEEFIATCCHLLLYLGICPTPIYIKLSENKYVQIFKERDLIAPKDLEKYTVNNYCPLYIKRSDAKKFLDFSEKNVFTFLDNPVTSADQLVTIHDIMSLLANDYELNAQMLKMTNAAVKKSMEFITKFPTVNSLLAEYFKKNNAYLPLQSILTIHIALGITSKMSWSSEMIQFKLSTAGLLQNVVLPRFDLTQYNEISEIHQNKSTKDKSIIAKYFTHPELAAQIVKQLKDISPDIDRLILEHHELPNGQGFPRKLISANIDTLSAVFIMSSQLAETIFEFHQNNPNEIVNWNNISPLFNKRCDWQIGVFKKIFLELPNINFFSN